MRKIILLALIFILTGCGTEPKDSPALPQDARLYGAWYADLLDFGNVDRVVLTTVVFSQDKIIFGTVRPGIRSVTDTLRGWSAQNNVITVIDTGYDEDVVLGYEITEADDLILTTLNGTANYCWYCGQPLHRQ